MAAKPATYNSDQWIDSFENGLHRKRPHMTGRFLTTVALSSWRQYGTKGIDPHAAANEVSESMDRLAGPR